MSVFDPDSIAHGRREAKIEEELETAVEEAIAAVADAYTDAFASFAKHEANFSEAQIAVGRCAVFSHFVRRALETIDSARKESSE